MDKIRPPTPIERKATFWFLKHASSYTCWSRICEAYEELLEHLEKLGDPSLGTAAFPLDDYERARWTTDEMRRALAQLRAGDRRCFDTKVEPNFRNAAEPVIDWFRLYNEGRYGPGHIGPFYMSYTAYWPTLCGLLIECLAEWSFGSSILNFFKALPPHAPYRPHYSRFYHPDYQFTPNSEIDGISGREVPKMNQVLRWFRDHVDRFPELPSPPHGSALRILRSEEPIPTTGIWEPFRCSPEALAQRITDAPENWDHWGPPCHPDLLNYLHEGIPAPTYKRWHSQKEDWVFERVTWLLLWEDDRYGEKGIPTEEEELFPRLPRELGMIRHRAHFEAELRNGGFD